MDLIASVQLGNEGKVHVWDGDSFECHKVLTHGFEVFLVELFPHDPTLLAAAGGDQGPRLITVRNLPKDLLTENVRLVLCELIFYYPALVVQIWDWREGYQLCHVANPNGAVFGMAINEFKAGHKQRQGQRSTQRRSRYLTILSGKGIHSFACKIPMSDYLLCSEPPDFVTCGLDGVTFWKFSCPEEGHRFAPCQLFSLKSASWSPW